MTAIGPASLAMGGLGLVATEMGVSPEVVAVVLVIAWAMFVGGLVLWTNKRNNDRRR